MFTFAGDLVHFLVAVRSWMVAVRSDGGIAKQLCAMAAPTALHVNTNVMTYITENHNGVTYYLWADLPISISLMSRKNIFTVVQLILQQHMYMYAVCVNYEIIAILVLL